jgi:ATP-binding cassette subfamily B protein
MSAVVDKSDAGTSIPSQSVGKPAEAVLPEFRRSWWETGLRARADAGVLGVFAELPGLINKAVRVAWRADRLRTLLVAVATVGAGSMAAFGLLATQRILIELFAAGPTPDRVRAAVPALAWLAVRGHGHPGRSRHGRRLRPQRADTASAARRGEGVVRRHDRS